MSVLRKIPISFFAVLSLILGIGLAIWQYDLVINRDKPTSKTRSAVDLQFRMNDGRTVTVPEDTSQYSVVVFWGSSSERSIAMISEVVAASENAELDSIYDFYLVNVEDSPEEIRQTVAFDNTDLPFGYNPTGGYLENSPVRSLPVTIIFSPSGAVFAGLEGYSPDELTDKLHKTSTAMRYMDSSGEFKFRIE